MRDAIIAAGLLAMAGLSGASLAETPKAPLTVEQRLQRVEDELAIRRIIVDYAATQDARDYAAYANLFATDGEWANGKAVHKGRAAIRQLLINLYGTPPAGFVNNENYHLTSNIQIDIDGDRATAHSRHLLIWRGPNGEPVPALAGRYEDEFIRENGEWKIRRRVDYPVMPTAEEWMKVVRARQAAQ
ncbi:uncharacterized protein (TIGR02246 family) [Sphingobium sp. B7D2B]|uniref:nuclear transport factor 2 family protein n=1 Tax=Sphingobium sp. B7D2B TaxID=2940583 RepID=UPI0022257B28|nr:nuclear transport factor 2 family protein [Sphingobium sp. B7D2B]MCW2367680.1 uncharacterized protein (TIGR02246 family) [Sphingobium sp. B7D2B]